MGCVGCVGCGGCVGCVGVDGVGVEVEERRGVEAWTDMLVSGVVVRRVVGLGERGEE